MGLALIRKKKPKKKPPSILCLLGVCNSTSTSTINKALGEIGFFDDRKNSDVLLKEFFPWRNCYKQSNCVDEIRGKCQKQSINPSLTNHLTMAVPMQIFIQNLATTAAWNPLPCCTSAVWRWRWQSLEEHKRWSAGAKSHLAHTQNTAPASQKLNKPF